MLIPDNKDNFESDGERILYRKFRLDGSTNEMYVLHSVFTNHHLKNISGELDFLVLAPNEGFFCIEVKHGGVFRRNGEWCFTNRYGNTDCKKTGPFEQQSITMNSIRKYVLQKIKHKKDLHKRFKKLLWGTGVAFTSMKEFIDFGPEGHSWQVLSKEGLKLPIGSYISTLSRGSHREHADKHWYDVHSSRPTTEDCVNLVSILRGDFDIDYTEINRMVDNEERIKDYTHEQFELLDFVNYNPRCLITGSAGTGKTLMALELSMRKTAEEKHIGLFCFNTLLGEKLQTSLHKMTSNSKFVTYCGPLHKFLASKVKSRPPENAEEKENYFAENLPLEFFIENNSINEEDKLDFLILDEAQDLLSVYYMEIFDSILKGGLKNGNWIMFGDFSNQAIYRNDAEKLFDLLNSYGSFTRCPPLKVNCRNTKSIAEQNTLVTGAELPAFTYRNEIGPNVLYRYPSNNQEAEELKVLLKEIESRKLPLDRITLLSPKALQNSVIRDYAPVLEMIKKGVNHSTIQSYKGLENNIIILYDFDEISSSRMQKLLYVGISRATQELYFVLNKELQPALIELIKENYPKTKLL